MNKIEEPAREGFLYHLWLERQFDVQLFTIDGLSLEIVEKGIRNYDAGPDFLNALVRIDSQLLRGDIEMHPIAGDWYVHGHHRDPRYNNVVLHLVTMDCPPTFRTIREDGSLIPTLNLDDYLEKTAEELEVETEVISPKPFDCALGREKESTIRQLLERAGDARFEIKVHRFAERRHTDSWDQIIYQALMEALGYSKNQIPFRQLADILPVETLWSFIWNDPLPIAQKKCEAYLFGAAGLLPHQNGQDASLPPIVKKYADELGELWNQFPLKQKIDVLKPGAWQFFRLRPANFPTRRIAAASMIVVRFMSDGFVGTLEKTLTDLANKPKKIHKELEHLFVFPTHAFWSNHFTFEESRGELTGTKEGCVLGQERARDIVVNVVLAALAAYADEALDLRLKNIIWEAYKWYPLLNDNEITRRMCEQIFATTTRPDVVFNARLQQGLVHLKKEMCQPVTCRVCLDEFTGKSS